MYSHYTISELMGNALKVLRQYYWKALLLSSAAMFINFIHFFIYCLLIYSLNVSYTEPAVVFILSIALVVIFLINSPIQIGNCRVYLRGRNGNVPLLTIFSSFKKYLWIDAVKVSFLTNLKIYLWSLLFVVPGIVKGLGYVLVPFIVADNPNIYVSRAFEISTETMRGERKTYIILNLPFIGLFIVAFLLTYQFKIIPFILLVFSYIYYKATMCEFYCCMRSKALARGIALSNEFPEVSSFANRDDNNLQNISM